MQWTPEGNDDSFEKSKNIIFVSVMSADQLQAFSGDQFTELDPGMSNQLLGVPSRERLGVQVT